MGKSYGKILGKAGCLFSVYIIFCATGGIPGTLAITYDPVEPLSLVNNPSEYVGEFVTFQAVFSHIITPSTKELLSSPTGAGVNIYNYDSFMVYAGKSSLPRLLMYKTKDSILKKLKQLMPITIYGQVFMLNIVGEPIIIVHKIEKVDNPD